MFAERAGQMPRLFGLSGQQVGALGATFLALKTPPEVAATGIKALLLTLRTADKQGKKFQAALGSIGLSAQGLKQSIEQDAQGALLGFLEAVRGSDDVMGTLTDLFGREYADDISSLVGSLDLYRRAVGLAADERGAAGSMQAEFEARAATAANAVMLMENSARAAQIALGTKLLPDVTRMSNVAATGADTLGHLVDVFPRFTRLAVGASAALGGLATVVAPVLEAAGGLLMAAAWMQLRAAKAQLAAAGRGIAGDTVTPVGGPGGKGGRVRDLGKKLTEGAKNLSTKVKSPGGLGQLIKGGGGKLLGLLKGKAGILGAVIAAASIGSRLLDSETSAAEKTRGVSGDVGALGGALAGAGLGASIGTVVFPGAGTAVGGILGGVAGGIGGGLLGDKAGAAIAGPGEGAPLGGLTAANGASIDNSSHVGQLIINQQPGEDAQALAKRVLREIEAERRLGAREALHDEL